MLRMTQFVTARLPWKPTMNIDIDTLTEPELIDLNHRVVALRAPHWQPGSRSSHRDVI